MQRVSEWLEKLGLVQYAQRFAENDITFAILPDLTDQDLKELGVASLGHRRQLLRAIVELGNAPTTAPNAPRSYSPTPIAPPPDPAGEHVTLRSCSAIWLVRPASPQGSMPRSGATSSAPISTPPRRRSPPWAATSPRNSAPVSLLCSAIRWRTRTMRNARHTRLSPSSARSPTGMSKMPAAASRS